MLFSRRFECFGPASVPVGDLQSFTGLAKDLRADVAWVLRWVLSPRVGGEVPAPENVDGHA